MKNNLRYLRRSQDFDMTQQELADALEVSRATIVSIENGGNTTDEMVIKIARFFNKDPRDIFFLDGVAHTEREVEISTA